jgi:hypothetical protein
MDTLEIHSKKSNSIFTVSGTKERAYLTVTGEACYKSKVQKEIKRIRESGGSYDEVAWTARMLASTY